MILLFQTVICNLKNIIHFLRQLKSPVKEEAESSIGLGYLLKGTL